MPNLDKPFYIKFLKTKIFFGFMKKKIFPLSLQDKLDILFFDDKVNEKLSRESGMKKIETNVKHVHYYLTNVCYKPFLFTGVNFKILKKF